MIMMALDYITRQSGSIYKAVVCLIEFIYKYTPLDRVIASN